MQPYTNDYYELLHSGSLQSARAVVPMVMQMIHPHSVVDVGCGQGAWLSVFRECGVADILGLDGDYVDRDKLAIPNQDFSAHDLTQPICLKRSFDLVVSLEVAEHLPADCAGDFIVALTGLGPVVFFSAAAPYQGGAHHVNEQWPAYWAELFSGRGYLPVDCLRRRLWANPKVDWWYAQNAFLYVAQGYLETHSVLRGEFEAAGPDALPFVHPRRYLEWIEWGLSQQKPDAAGETTYDEKLT